MTVHESGEMDPKEAQSILLDAISGKLQSKIAKIEEDKPALERILGVLRANVGKGRYNDKQEQSLAKAITAVELTIKLVGPGNTELRKRGQRELDSGGEGEEEGISVLSPDKQRRLVDREKRERARLMAKGFLHEVSDEIGAIERSGEIVMHPKEKNRVVTTGELRDSGKTMAGGFKEFFALDQVHIRALFGDINEERGETVIGRICNSITEAKDFRERYRQVILELRRIISE